MGFGLTVAGVVQTQNPRVSIRHPVFLLAPAVLLITVLGGRPDLASTLAER
jgi:hypothetical protein